jgi:hypothetical protein
MHLTLMALISSSGAEASRLSAHTSAANTETGFLSIELNLYSTNKLTMDK